MFYDNNRAVFCLSKGWIYTPKKIVLNLFYCIFVALKEKY